MFGDIVLLFLELIQKREIQILNMSISQFLTLLHPARDHGHPAEQGGGQRQALDQQQPGLMFSCSDTKFVLIQ